MGEIESLLDYSSTLVTCVVHVSIFAGNRRRAGTLSGRFLFRNTRRRHNAIMPCEQMILRVAFLHEEMRWLETPESGGSWVGSLFGRRRRTLEKRDDEGNSMFAWLLNLFCG
jgi:hypothetical protein